MPPTLHPSALALSLVLVLPMGAQSASSDRSASISPAASNSSGKDASATLGAAPGVKVTQLTMPPNGHELSYYDIAAYSPATGLAYVNRRRIRAPGIKPVWDVLAVDLATAEQSLLVSRRPPDSATARFDMSADGRLISYLRMNDPPERGFDLYGYRLDRPGEFRITRADYAVQGATLKTSPAAWDAQTTQYLLAYTIGPQLYVVRDDGKSAAGNGPQAVPLDDPDRGLSFHRLRLDPVYPHIVFYRRETKTAGAREPGAPPRLAMYLADLRATPPRGVPFAPADGASHPGWTPDGQKIAVAGAWTEYTVVDGRGRLTDSLAERAMPGKRIGPFAPGIRERSEAFYGTYSPDGRWIAIATRASKKAPGELFLMDASEGTVRRLCRTDYFGRHTAGAPRIAFVGNTGKILLSTDASWGRKRAELPQLYLVDPGSGATNSRGG